MSEPFLGEIKIFSFNFPPKGWAFCNGQLLPINQNQALFAILGTTYGGNGTTTFALPNLQARVPMHVGNGINLGQVGGEASHTLTIQELAQHTHIPSSGGAASSPDPANSLPGQNASQSFYAAAPNTTMNLQDIQPAGGSQPHNNMSPYLVLVFCIALQGIFPSRT